MEIKKKMPLFVLFIVAVPIIVISLTVYFVNSRAMLKSSKNNMSLSTSLVSNHVNDIVENEKNEAYMLSQQKEIVDAAKTRQQEGRDEFFKNYGTGESPADLVLKKKFQRLKDHQHLSLVDSSAMIICDSDPDNVKVDLSSRKYFKEAISGRECVGDVMKSKIKGKSVIVFAAPVKDENGKVIGVIANTVYTDFFTKSLSKIKFGSTGYAYMVDSRGMMLSHPDKDKILKPVQNNVIKSVADRVKDGQNVESSVGTYKYNGSKKLSGYIVIPGVKWILAASQNMSEVNKDTRNILFINSAIGLVIALLAIFIGLKFSSNITTPLGKLLVSMDTAAEGDVTVRSDISGDDEIGKLSSGFNKMIENLSGIIDNVKSNSGSVEEQSVNLSSVSNEIASSSQNVADTIQEVAKGSESQAEDLDKINSIVNNFALEIENIVKSIQEMYKSIGNINEMSMDSNDKMKILKDSINGVSTSFKDFMNKINNLNEGIKQIDSIVDVIDNITDQTNLLALNASIEAARVGEKGKGFVVVASEIGELAEKSKESAGNIAHLIEKIYYDTKLMVKSAGDVNIELKQQIDPVGDSIEAFMGISKAVGTVDSEARLISSSASKIDDKKNQIVGRIESASSTAQQVSASAEEVSATSEEVSASTEEISSSVDKLSSTAKVMTDSVKKFTVK